MLAPGTLLSKRYRLKRQLDNGGMGTVWSAIDEHIRRPVAVKALLGSAGGGSEQELSTERMRLLREARAASKVRHPNVVHVIDVAEASDVPYLVMELLSGMSLRQHLDRVGSLDVETACTLLLEVASGLAAAHDQGVIHRDLKPDNIFLVEGPNRRPAMEGDSLAGMVVGSGEPLEGSDLQPQAPYPRVKVLDFGIAKVIHHAGSVATAKLTKTGHVIGTAPYMSPEQTFGEEDIDHRTDLWSFGIVLYECLSGVLPTRAPNTGQIFKIITKMGIPPIEARLPDVPSELAQLLARLLAQEPEDRPADMREVMDVLALCAAKKQTATKAPVVAATPEKQPRSRLRGSFARLAPFVLSIAAATAILIALRHDDKGDSSAQETPTVSPPTAQTASPTVAPTLTAIVAPTATAAATTTAAPKTTARTAPKTTARTAPKPTAPSPPAGEQKPNRRDILFDIPKSSPDK